MKIIEQTWEKRNLGIRSFDIELDLKDSINDLNEVINNFNYSITDYLIVRVPLGRMDMSYRLQDNGFRFSEVFYSLEFKPQKITNLINMQAFNGISDSEANPEQLQELFDHVQDNLFNTDRIALDPLFSPEASGYRYVCWMQDEIKKGAKTYIISHNNQDIGFYMLRLDAPGVWCSLFGAIFKEYAHIGYGPVMLNQQFLRALSGDIKIIRSGVSSNNPAIFNIDMYFGAKIKKMNYIFTKHFNV